MCVVVTGLHAEGEDSIGRHVATSIRERSWGLHAVDECLQDITRCGETQVSHQEHLV